MSLDQRVLHLLLGGLEIFVNTVRKLFLFLNINFFPSMDLHVVIWEGQTFSRPGCGKFTHISC